MGSGGSLPNSGQVLNFAANAVTQLSTGGLVSYEDGKFGKGVSAQAVDEGVGELTGRNMARQQINDARTAVADEAAAREEEIKDERELARRRDVQASRAAATTRRPGVSSMMANSNVQNYLGLS